MVEGPELPKVTGTSGAAFVITEPDVMLIPVPFV